VDLLRSAEPPIVVPSIVVAEVAYLIERALGPRAEALMLRSLADPRYRVEPLLPADLLRMADLVEPYADLPLGATDAAVVAIAERLGLDAVATLDRRHFSVVRPAHVDSLTLVP
jgi:uncharacterized protein